MRLRTAALVLGALSLTLVAAPATAVTTASPGPATTTVQTIESDATITASKKSLKARFGTFKTKKVKGTGDDIIRLPKKAKSGMITVTAKGADGATVGIQLLDKNGDYFDFTKRRALPYKGTIAFGLNKYEKRARFVKVTGAESWTVRIQPLHKAKKLPKKGTQDGVYRAKLKKNKIWKFTYKGERNFIVWSYSSKTKRQLLANTINSWKGKKVVKKFSGIVEVESSGRWKIKR